MTETTLRKVKPAAYGISEAGMLVLHHAAGVLYASQYGVDGSFVGTIGTRSEPDYPRFPHLVALVGPLVTYLSAEADYPGKLVTWNPATGDVVERTMPSSTDGVPWRVPIFDRDSGLLWWAELAELGTFYEWRLYSAPPETLLPTQVSTSQRTNPVDSHTAAPYARARNRFVFASATANFLTSSKYLFDTKMRFDDFVLNPTWQLEQYRFIALNRDGSDGSDTASPPYWDDTIGAGGEAVVPYGIPYPGHPGEALASQVYVRDPDTLVAIDESAVVTDTWSPSGDQAFPQSDPFEYAASISEDGARVTVAVVNAIDPAAHRVVSAALVGGGDVRNVVLATHPDAPTARLVGAFPI